MGDPLMGRVSIFLDDEVSNHIPRILPENAPNRSSSRFAALRAN